MKKLFILILTIFILIVGGLAIHKQTTSSVEYLKVKENEINDYLTKYLSDSPYEKLDTFITDDQIICYVLLKNKEEGVLLQLTKTKNGYTYKKSSRWDLSSKPISLLKVHSNSHTSALQVGIIIDDSINVVRFISESNKTTEFVLNGSKGFIQPIEEPIVKIEGFDKDNNLVWSKGPI